VGTRVISCDPIYQWEAIDIREQITATCDQILDQTRRSVDEFVWHSFRSVEELGRVRVAAMPEFLDDFGQGNVSGRYIAARAAGLSVLQLLLRPGTVFPLPLPLLAFGGQRSPYIDRRVEQLREAGYDASIENVPYEFQRGGNQMMRIRRAGRRMANIRVR